MGFDYQSGNQMVYAKLQPPGGTSIFGPVNEGHRAVLTKWHPVVSETDHPTLETCLAYGC
jgi:hypothetical protein